MTAKDSWSKPAKKIKPVRCFKKIVLCFDGEEHEIGKVEVDPATGEALRARDRRKGRKL